MIQQQTERWLWIWYTPYGLGGVENFLRMVTANAKSNISHYVAAIQSLEGPLRTQSSSECREILDWTSFYVAYMRRESPASACARLCSDINSIQPNVVMINGCTDFGIGAAQLLRKLSPYAKIVDSFHIDPIENTYLNHRRAYLHCLDGLVSSNRGAFEKMNAIFPRARRLPQAYIPYATEIPRSQRDAPTKNIRLLYLGRLDEPQKRVSVLPDVLFRARELGANVSLSIAGDGPERESLERKFQSKGLCDYVRFLGYVSQETASRLLIEHDCMVNVSRFEGFSISVIEALAAGCVPICTRLSNMDFDVLKNGENCLLCSLSQPLEMADIIAKLEPLQLEKLSTAAMKAGRQFSPDRMRNSYQSFATSIEKRGGAAAYPKNGVPPFTWDVSRGNPWLHRVHPIKRVVKSFLKLLNKQR